MSDKDKRVEKISLSVCGIVLFFLQIMVDAGNAKRWPLFSHDPISISEVSPTVLAYDVGMALGYFCFGLFGSILLGNAISKGTDYRAIPPAIAMMAYGLVYIPALASVQWNTIGSAEAVPWMLAGLIYAVIGGLIFLVSWLKRPKAHSFHQTAQSGLKGGSDMQTPKNPDMGGWKIYQPAYTNQTPHAITDNRPNSTQPENVPAACQTTEPEIKVAVVSSVAQEPTAWPADTSPQPFPAVRYTPAPAPQPKPKPSKQLFCRNCGSPIEAETKKCTGCGKQYFRRRRLLLPSAFLSVLLSLAVMVGAIVWQNFQISDLRSDMTTKTDEVSSLEDKLSEAEKTIEKKEESLRTKEEENRRLTTERNSLMTEKNQYYAAYSILKYNVYFLGDDGRYHEYGCFLLDADDMWSFPRSSVDYFDDYESCPYCVH